MAAARSDVVIPDQWPQRRPPNHCRRRQARRFVAVDGRFRVAGSARRMPQRDQDRLRTKRLVASVRRISKPI